ncbi:MAG: YHYH protein [Euryarchaeota archaeon]|nr:YHYH protein [Euryarchaeota archaeon]
MDSKTAIMSALLVGLMISSSLAVFFAVDSPDTNEQQCEGEGDTWGPGIGPPPADCEEGISPGEELATEQSIDDRPPTLFVGITNFAWGEPVSLSGWLVDESPNSTSITASVYSAESISTPSLEMTTFAEPNGVWEILLPYDEPGSWAVQLIATDETNQTSISEIIDVTLNAPIEEMVLVTIRYESPEENETTGLITGELIHLFPSSCGVEFWPEGQSIIEGFVNSSESTFRIPVDVTEVAKQGDFWITCGIYDVRARNISYQLPIPDEPSEDTISDQDNDGIVDADDVCPNTPNDEPVWPNGCSESQLDSDGDGISDNNDLCPNTYPGEIVDSNGCSETQKDADGDGISDAGDQCPNTPSSEVADANGCSDSQKDQDGDGVQDSLDQCPNTLSGTVVDSTGCEITWVPQDSWLCQNGQGPWVKDFNSEEGFNSNTNGASSAGASNDNVGPWFQCKVDVNTQNGEMVVDANGIPNHDFLSTMGCCVDEVDLEWHIPLNPMNDTSGGHNSANCPASAGRWECAPDRGPVAVSVNGAPIYGVEEGPGGDAIALNFDYFVEDRQPIALGYCTGHAAGNNFHYHYDAQCSTWVPGVGDTISDYDWTKLDSTQHSPIIGWAFDGYPIYGMYGNDGNGGIRAITSSYEVERTQEGGDQGYNGIDDWNYVSNLGDLDECNGRFGPTPEYPNGIYHYVSTPLSGSSKLVTDTNGAQVDMIGMPYFLLCYHGVADLDAQPSGGQGPPGPGGRSYEFNTVALYNYQPNIIEPQEDESISLLLDFSVTMVLIAILFGSCSALMGRRD